MRKPLCYVLPLNEIAGTEDCKLKSEKLLLGFRGAKLLINDLAFFLASLPSRDKLS